MPGEQGSPTHATSRSGRVLCALVALTVAVASYLGATGVMASLVGYRSPVPVLTPDPSTAAPMPALSHRVVAVLVDGLRVDTAAQASLMPFLAQLRSEGAATTMRVRTPSYSVPGWTVLMTGAWIEVHGGLAMNPETPSTAPVWTQDNVFTAAHDAGLRTGVSGTDWFAPLIPPAALSTSYFVHDESDAADQASTDAAIRMLAGEQVDFLLVHLNEVDYAGHHRGGATSPAGYDAATKADARLRQIAAALDLSRDTLVVFSDHGHLDQGGHGGPEDVVERSPLVLAGAGVRAGATIGDPTRLDATAADQADLAPTLAALLGTRVPTAAQGQALTALLTAGEASASLHAAQAAQQHRLLDAYAGAVGAAAPSHPAADAADPVRDAETTLAGIRENRIAADRLSRLPLVGVLALLLLGALAWLARRRPRRFGWALAAAAAYLLVSEVGYHVVAGRTWSLSSVASVTDVLLVIAGVSAAGIGAAWLVGLVAARVDRSGRRGLVAGVGEIGLLVGAMLAVPILVGAYLGGWTVGWWLPDPVPMFLQFFAQVQLLVVAVLTLLAGGVAMLVERAAARTPAAG